MERRPATENDDHSVHFVNSDDSRVIRRAYSGLLFVWQWSDSFARDTPAAMIDYLTTFVMEVSGFDPLATTVERIELIRDALLLLWLFLERRVDISGDEYPQMLLYSLTVLEWLWFIPEKDNFTQRQWY
ncbi:hypothetical protein RhiJN_08551 [Ceratobasidium sp. AG-Ba]|nr:hypothetical protein RhiJN_08551 [Ceratobasidium sp. AG-Ba]QRW09336.1 hypothetical protein RhiLY_08335 [Ceratobasidium sp. AG-Ba]